jgi:arylformamidase
MNGQAIAQVGQYRVISLSKVIDPAVEKRRCVVRRHEACVNDVVDYHTDMDLMSHLGTHVEAPYHHRSELSDVTHLSVGNYVGRGVLLKLDTCEPRALITRADLDAASGGIVQAGDVAILDSPYHHEPFVQSPDDERPRLSIESAEWFLEHQVKAVGFGDGVAIENNPKHCSAFHDILMPKNVTFIEVMQNLDQIRDSVFMIVFLPLPIVGLDSSPVHVVAIEGVPGFCA